VIITLGGLMSKMEELTTLLSDWKAAKKEYARTGRSALLRRITRKIHGLEAAIDIIKKPPNTRMQMDQKPCFFCNNQMLNNPDNDFCGKCGMAFDH
jgi:hypothetical protein